MFSLRRVLVTSAMALASPVLIAADLVSPVPHILTVIDRIVADVAEQRDQLEQDETKCSAFALVDRHLRPEFNLHLAARYMLLQHWPSAASAQDRFVNAFYGSVVATFGDLIRHFDANTLRMAPADDLPDGERLKIDGEMTFTDETTVDLSFRVRLIDDLWQIFDVQAGSMSYVEAYRDEYLYDIAEIGLDGLIERLEKEAADYRACGQ